MVCFSGVLSLYIPIVWEVYDDSIDGVALCKNTLNSSE